MFAAIQTAIQAVTHTAIQAAPQATTQATAQTVIEMIWIKSLTIADINIAIQLKST